MLLADRYQELLTKIGLKIEALSAVERMVRNEI
jgi:hypothetical protein